MNRDFSVAWIITVAVVALAASAGLARAQADDEVKRFDLRIENGRLADNRKVIDVDRGDAVEINWSADRPTVVHLHGYDLQITAGPSQPQAMSFTARATGRFPIEVHGSQGRHTVVIYLEVHPQ
jgi:hypothetical protein